MTRLRPPVRTAAVAGLGLVAVAPLAGLYGDAGWLVHATVAAAVVLAVSLVLAPRWPLAVSLPAAVFAVVLTETVAVRRRVPTGPSVAATWTAMVRSADVLLVAAPPVAGTVAATTFPAVLAAVATFAAAELAARFRAPGPAVAVAVGTYGIASWLAAGTGTVPVAGLALLAATVAVLAGERRRPAVVAPAGLDAGTAVVRARPVPRRAAAPAAVSVLAVAALFVSGVVPLTWRPPPDPQDRWRPPPVLTPEPTPLALISPFLRDPADPVVFRMAVDRPVGRRPVPVARLDDYDGERWGSAGAFAAVRDGARSTPGAGSGDPVGQDYTLTGAYGSPFLPALDTAVTVGPAGAGLLREPDTGTLRLRERAADGFRYHVTSRSPSPPEESTAPVPLDPEAEAALTRVPSPVPAELGRWVHDLGADRAPRDRLEAASRALHDGVSRADVAGFDPAAPPGHSYRRLARFLGIDTRPSAERARLGTSEQPAAAIAVVARMLGFPSRVVVGFDVDTDAAPGEVAVHAHQIRAWAEVHLDGRWVTYDPTPAGQHPPVAPRPGTMPPSPPTTSDPPHVSIVPGNLGPVAGGRAGAAPRVGGPCAAGDDDCRPVPVPVGPAWGWAAVIVPTMLAGAGLRAARRTWRRRRGGAAHRIASAWRETLDRLWVHGVRVPGALTAGEVAGVCRPRLGPDVAAAVARWGPVLDATIYGEHEPRDHLARRAWRLDAEVAASLRHRSGVWTRGRAALDPRPLVRRARRRS